MDGSTTSLTEQLCNDSFSCSNLGKPHHNLARDPPPFRLPTMDIPEQKTASIPSLKRLQHKVAQPVVAAFIAGGVAGAISRTVVSPLERLKILFQVQSAGRDAYTGSVGRGLAKMWRDEGWKGLMRGNGTNCVRIVPYSAVQFGSYNVYQRVRGGSFAMFQPCLGNQLTIIVVHDGCHWDRAGSDSETRVRRHGWNYLGHFYLPARHRSNSPLHPIGFFC